MPLSVRRENGVRRILDEMIPIANSYRLVENLPNAVLLVYPDSGPTCQITVTQRCPLRAKQRSDTERSGREEPLARTQTTSYPHARLMGARKPRRDVNRGRRLLAHPESSQWR